MTTSLQSNATAITRDKPVKSGVVKTSSSIPAPLASLTLHDLVQELIGEAKNGDTSTKANSFGDGIATIRRNDCTFATAFGIPLGQRSLGRSGDDTNSSQARCRSSRRHTSPALGAPPLGFIAAHTTAVTLALLLVTAIAWASALQAVWVAGQ